MKETLISFETAKLAKEKGFDWKVMYFYAHPTEYKLELTEYNINEDEDIDFTNYNEKDDFHWLYYSAPTQSVLQKWLRERCNIDIVIEPERYSDGINYCIQAQMFDLAQGDASEHYVVKATHWFNDNHEYPTYEEALEKGLQEALKLIDNENKS